MNNIIPIFYTVDENYIPLLSVSLASLIDHSSKDNTYHVHIMYQNVTKESIDKVKTLETDNVKIFFDDVHERLNETLSLLNTSKISEWWNISIYLRIFIPVMYPEYEKGIYIDSDTVLNDDIKDLYNTNLEGKLVGACHDISIENIDDFIKYIEQADGVPFKEYINSGVLVMDLTKLREKEFTKHFLYLLEKYNFDTVAPDQDYINVILNGNIKYIDNKWNSMPCEGLKPMDNPSLIHYNLFYKPWHYDGIDYEDYFWKYANKSLFKDAILKEKEDYKDTAMENISGMIAFGLEQIDKDINFKKIINSGKEDRL